MTCNFKISGPATESIRRRLMVLVDKWRDLRANVGHAQSCADDLEALAEVFDGEEAKVFEHLDSILSRRCAADEGLVEAARLASEEHDELKDRCNELKDRCNRLEQKLEEHRGGDFTADGYHAFATAIGWRYPDGGLMPTWGQLDYDTQAAFEAFARVVQPEADE